MRQCWDSFQGQSKDRLDHGNNNRHGSEQAVLKPLKVLERLFDAVNVRHESGISISDDGFEFHDSYLKIVLALLRHWVGLVGFSPGSAQRQLRAQSCPEVELRALLWNCHGQVSQFPRTLRSAALHLAIA